MRLPSFHGRATPNRFDEAGVPRQMQSHPDAASEASRRVAARPEANALVEAQRVRICDHVYIPCAGGGVAIAMAFELDRDCGIYNVGTLEHARRRGLGTGVAAVLLHDALGRGCATASLQATPMADRLYAALGFRELGRIIEYAPPASH